ncbi:MULTISPECIES: hypothetical protein [unclassified Herbaspirillum]|jgi:hypothetical protein|uniref:hypothetical protein n=1 Tax=unclassified Herbaspirillum TaxID=2624150 RepID=UPI0013147568|nr:MULTISPECIES: hypothetical protein [unclassified Herbaspirillum]
MKALNIRIHAAMRQAMRWLVDTFSRKHIGLMGMRGQRRAEACRFAVRENPPK